jgi:hypothetical protein
MIVNKLHFDRSPESELIFADFDLVTPDNVDAFGENWDIWLSND